MRTLLLSALVVLSVSACGKPAEITIKAGDDMKFDTATFTAKAGQEVKLTLINTGSSPVMKHNLVITKPGADADVAAKGIEAGEAKGYVPALDTVLASTPLADPGRTVKVTFKAPPAGDYPFLCTFPGHAATMKGVFKVTAE